MKIFILTWIIILQSSFIIACDDQNTQSDLGTSLDLISYGLTCCPLKNHKIREPDAVAREGGGFYANRGSNSCHFAIDLETFSATGESGEGKRVFASGAGTVVLAIKNWGKAGHTVIIDHGQNVYSLYAHLQVISVNYKEQVQAGESVGTVGYSGNAEQLRAKGLPAHLHFMIIKTLEPLSNWKPLSIVREIEKIDDIIPHMDNFGFIDSTSWLGSTCPNEDCGIPSTPTGVDIGP